MHATPRGHAPRALRETKRPDPRVTSNESFCECRYFGRPSLGAMWNGDSLLKKMNAKRSVCSKSGANNWRLFPILNFSIRSRESRFAKLFTYFKVTYIRRKIRPGTNKMRVSLISIFNYFMMWLIRVNSYDVNHTKMYSC